MGMKENRNAELPACKSPPASQASSVCCETLVWQIWRWSAGSPPNAVHVDRSDRDDESPLSQLDLLPHKLRCALAPVRLLAIGAIQPKLRHMREFMQSLLNSERESTEMSECTRAPWLDPMVTCVPKRWTKPAFQASIFSSV